MKRLLLFCLLLLQSICLVPDAGRMMLKADRLADLHPRLVNVLQNNRQCIHWVDSVLQSLTLKERIGQLFIYTIAPQQSKANRELLRKVVKEYKVGGLLFSGGLIEDQVALTNEAQQMADVPLLLTFDGEWGLAMRLKQTPSFPRNMVLGCIQDDSLIYEYGREVARQCREIGVQVNFAPVADVNINPANPVINTRSFGENPERVADKVVAYARGLEAGGVLSVSKHFPGHGDTDVDSHKALPVLPFTPQRLDSVELYPFRQVVRAGLGGIMVGHLEVPALEPEKGLPASLSRRVVSGLLKDVLQFKGLVFTDALAMSGVAAHDNVCLKALKAGNDLLLAPHRVEEEIEAVVDAVKKGELSDSIVSAKCRKVLTYKYALGLTRKPHVRLSGLDARLNAPAVRELIQQLQYAAITVLANREELLPLDVSLNEVAVLCVGSSAALSPFVQTLSQDMKPNVFQLSKNPTTAECRQLKEKLQQYRRVLVCLADRQLSAYQTFFQQYLPAVPMGYLCFVQGRQLESLAGPLSEAAAVVLAHSSDEAVQRQMARIVCGRAGANGRLSAGISEAFPAGCGVTLEPHVFPRMVPEEYGLDSHVLAGIDEIAEEGIRQGAYPGCQIVVLKDGNRVYDKCFGTHTGSRGTAVRVVEPTDVYDIASLTKAVATVLAVMKLYDNGRISLTDKVSGYLPYLQNTDKKDITVRRLLMHESGLPSTILFYQEAIDKDSFEGTLFKGKSDAKHGVRIGKRTWANPDFRFKSGLTSAVRTDSCTWQIADGLWLNPAFKRDYLQAIVDAPLLSRSYRYSCVGFILLQQLVEQQTGMPMDEFLNREFYRPMGLEHTGYLPLTFLNKEQIVPSSVDAFIRKDTLQGFVHDESAAFLGGVAGNAGLFSNAREVAQICQMLLNGGQLDGKRYLSEETCRLFTTTVSRTSRRGLGFDKPDKRNPQRSPCAPSAPASVYGHTGFTGTCAWIDPDNGLVYVFLSNRTYPQAWNNKLSSLDIRTRIQEVIYEALRR